jgi:hypothetical protein
MFQIMSQRHTWVSLAALAFSLQSTISIAQTSNTERELAEAAKVIAKELRKASVTKVSVREFEFDGQSSARITTGPRFQAILAKKLDGLNGIKVDLMADHYVDATFKPDTDAATRETGIRTKFVLKDAQGFTIVEFERMIFGLPDLVESTGATGAFPPNATPQVRNELAVKYLQQASTFLTTAATTVPKLLPGVYESQQAQYGIEILVEDPHGKLMPREAKVADAKENNAVVEIRRNEIYAVRLINNSEYDAAVALTVDGLSTFAFSETDCSVMLVPAGSDTVVTGWHRRNEGAHAVSAFKVTEYPESAAAKIFATNKPSSVGTINACFRAAWTGNKIPPDEPMDKDSRGALGTGIGPPRPGQFQVVRMTTGVVRANVAVRYLKR